MTKTILIINGPNLNMLGTREPKIYGTETLADIETKCYTKAKELQLSCVFKQSNNEGQIIEWLQQAKDNYEAIIINAGAYTHSSVAIRDALIISQLPIIEVHISNIYSREEFRHKSFISDIAKGVICGLGSKGYLYAMEYFSC